MEYYNITIYNETTVLDLVTTFVNYAELESYFNKEMQYFINFSYVYTAFYETSKSKEIYKKFHFY